MKMKLPKNLTAKTLSLLLAIAIWFLIKHHINTGGGEGGLRGTPVYPKVIPVPEP
jgi:hypothetical protein